MKAGYKNMRKVLWNFPHLIETLDQKQIDNIRKMFPYSIGIEIECSWLSHCGDEDANTIPIDLFKEIRCDTMEKRFRLHPGLGVVYGLHYLSEWLPKHCKFNKASGIHYHVDCSEFRFEDFTSNIYKNLNFSNNWVLTALESWNYKGNYNDWKISFDKEAIRLHIHYETIEFRIGEMTFSYKTLLTRVKHVSNITKKLKKDYGPK